MAGYLAAFSQFVQPHVPIWQQMVVIMPTALTISFVGYMESVSVAKSLASKRREKIDADQELLALGAANLGATFTGGYPFAGGSTVSVTIGDTEYELFTEGEWAWPATPEEDARLVAAMKRGADAIVRGRSGRGNQTIDTFSLLGFTAAVEEAARRCQ